MQQTIITLPEIKLVGISTRTNNKQEFNPTTAKIGNTMQAFFSNNLSEEIIERKSAEKIFSVYTNYENNFNGDYTYFIGEEVNEFVTHDNNILQDLTIPAQRYVKFTSIAGKFPNIVIDAWQKIWQMSDKELGGTRSYVADFEIYDERSYDPENAIVDIYIGLK